MDDFLTICYREEERLALRIMTMQKLKRHSKMKKVKANYFKNNLGTYTFTKKELSFIYDSLFLTMNHVVPEKEKDVKKLYDKISNNLNK